LKFLGTNYGRISVFVVLILSGQNLRGDEMTREFSPYKCKYTLADNEWSWLPAEQLPAHTLFVAVNQQRGLVVTLATKQGTGREHLDQKFADGFEKSFLESSKAKKRGARFLTFVGLPCYQLESTLPDNKSVIGRAFLANGYGYVLGMVGGAHPVEKEPNFEKYMNGFAFTSPPVQAPAANTKTSGNISFLAGQVVFWCLLGGAILWLFSKRSRA
jgi:hypothetical protein